MACVLGGSLALAYALTVSRQVPWTIGYTEDAQSRGVSVEGLELKIPERFEPVITADPPTPAAGVTAYTDRSTPQRRLKVSLLSNTRPRAPLPALNQAINVFMSNAQRRSFKPWQPVAPIRIGSFTGAWYAGLNQTPQGEDLHLIAVLTQDARRYWLIQLNHFVDEPSLVFEAMKVNSHLIRLIIGSATGSYLRQASPTDFTSAGLAWLTPTADTDLPGVLPAGLTARVPTHNRGHGPILLIPEDSKARLHLLRVRGVLDTESQTGLSPQTWLAQTFENQEGRPPRPDEFSSQQIGNTQLWRLTLVLKSAMLVRQTWYASLGHGRAVLIEAVCDPRALAQCGAWIEPLLTTWQQRLDANAPAAPALEDAVARGEHIAQWQHRHLSQLMPPGWSYYLTEEDSRLIGWQIERVLPRVNGDPMPIQGKFWLNWRIGAHLATLTRTWQAGLDGRSMAMDSRTTILSPETGKQTTTQDQIRVDGQRITIEQVKANGQTHRNTVDAPQPLILPIAEEVWPVRLEDGWHPDGALVWMSYGEDTPQPYWVDQLEQPQWGGTSQADHAPPAAVVRVRPLMSLDADLLSLNENAAMLRYETQQPTGTFAGATVVARRVTREELIEAFPDIEPELTQWEQDPTPQ